MVTLAASLAAIFVMTGCDEGPTFVGAPDKKPQSLVLSQAWRATVEEADASARLEDLQSAIDELRAETDSGWVGRQDDVTGYLTELTGGRYFGEATDPVTAANALLDTYGPRLFGIGSAQMKFEEESETDESGSMVLRGEQVVEGVPVLDATLIVTVGDPGGEPRVNAIRGRSFPDVEVSTEPGISARRAANIAAKSSGGEPQGEPELVVIPGEGGQLAWQLAVVGAEESGDQLLLADGIYFIDAQTGDLIDVRAASAHSRTLHAEPLDLADHNDKAKKRGPQVLAQGAPPQAVEVTGDDPTGTGTTLRGTGVANGGGSVALVDTTVPTFDPATGEGGIYTYDAGGTSDEEQLPGQLYVENGTLIADSEALAAHSLSRVVYDYYAELGRASWDGKSGSLVSSVNFGGDDFCNAFFSSSLQPPQMVYGNPCTVNGAPQETSTVEIDTAGHEITHGVISSSSNLIYSGQSGAMNESFADYFGNVIGNRFKDSDDASMFEGGCLGFSQPTVLCKPNPEGGFSMRYLLNGNTFEDYLYILNVPHRMNLLGADQDKGGVHLNSSIWNNALWSVRSRLAQMDNTTGNDSKLAQDFDKIVYATLTRKLAPASGFLDARDALEETTVEAGADPAILRVLQETMDFNKICDACADPKQGPGQVVTSAPQTQLAPAVSGDRIAWLDLQQGGGIFGFPAEARVGNLPANLASTPETAQVVFAGDSVITFELPGSVARYAEDGTKTVIDEGGVPTLVAGLGGSAEGAAWVVPETGLVKFVDPSGAITQANLKGLGNEQVTSVGTGLGTVALGTDGGSVFVWQPGGKLERVGNMTSGVPSIAAYGDRILAVDDAGLAAVFDLASGEATEVSQDAIPFGAAMSDKYAVWTNNRGVLEGGVARTEEATFPDTDLYMLSFETGQIYDLLPQRGQQGFPALSGDRLAWQDAVFGGDDVFTATIPAGL